MFNKKINIVFNWALLFIYAAVTLLIVLYHEPWRDEAQIWLIARYASFYELLNEISIVEPHPRLWFFALLPLAKMGMPYISMSILNWIFAVSAMALFLLKSPFNKWMKFAFAGSFLMMHEYAVMARPYSLAILIIFLIAHFYSRRIKKPWVYGMLLLALFNTSFLVFTLAGTLWALFAFDLWKQKRMNWHVCLMLFIIIAGAAVVYYQGNYHLTDQIQSELAEVKLDQRALTEAVGKSFFVAFVDVAQWLASTAGYIIMGAAVIYFIQKPRLLILLAGAWAGLFKIFLFHYPGSVRHHGFLIIVLLFVLWIDQVYEKEHSENIRLKWLIFPDGLRQFVVASLTVCFLITFKFTLWTSRMDYVAPFSGSKNVAQVINEVMEKLPEVKAVVAFPANFALPVKAHLPDKEFWYADVQETGTYLHNYRKMMDNKFVSHADLIIRAGKKYGDLSGVLLLTHRPLELSQAAGYEFKMIYAIDKPVWGYGLETYYLYKPVRKLF